jgi:hypothetical protein
MNEFSCRNCVQNPIQSISIGSGRGFCLQFNSVIEKPDRTTCKYLHRKDLPNFLVEEGVREHAAEFSGCPGMADLHTLEPVPKTIYREKDAWETHSFDPDLSAVAAYHRRRDEAEQSGLQKWRFIKAFSGSVDGRKSISFASMARRYMSVCGTWTSSYRFVLTIINDLDRDVFFAPQDLVAANGESREELTRAARWEVFFTRISGVQEYGWHAALDDLRFPMRHLATHVSDDDWNALLLTLKSIKLGWEDQVIKMAKSASVFFPKSESH